jgi:hypothetical protein
LAIQTYLYVTAVDAVLVSVLLLSFGSRWLSFGRQWANDEKYRRLLVRSHYDCSSKRGADCQQSQDEIHHEETTTIDAINSLSIIPAGLVN